MTTQQAPLSRQALTTPRAAAIAGILFALLNGATMVWCELTRKVSRVQR